MNQPECAERANLYIRDAGPVYTYSIKQPPVLVKRGQISDRRPDRRREKSRFGLWITYKSRGGGWAERLRIAF
ncbi:hypothetical protein BH09SUM1_BH09SUM1_07110 [soil metagenome]